MRQYRSHSRGNRRFRSGIFYFLVLMALLEVIRQNLHHLHQPDFLPAGPDIRARAAADSLRRLRVRDTALPRLWDPNRLNDYQGYRLGLSPGALDSLYAFRRTGKRMYSPADFATVTHLPDSALKRLLPRFRFPDRLSPSASAAPPGSMDRPGSAPQPGIGAGPPRDLNTATALQLQEVRGIGPVLSGRIVRFRDALGGFLDARQVRDVYGLSPEVAGRLLRQFAVWEPPRVQKVNLNTATVEQLARMVYLDRQMAEELVRCRERNGPFRDLGEIACAASIPRDRIDRIALYLTLTN